MDYKSLFLAKSVMNPNKMSSSSFAIKAMYILAQACPPSIPHSVRLYGFSIQSLRAVKIYAKTMEIRSQEAIYSVYSPKAFYSEIDYLFEVEDMGKRSLYHKLYSSENAYYNTYSLGGGRVIANLYLDEDTYSMLLVTAELDLVRGNHED